MSEQGGEEDSRRPVDGASSARGNHTGAVLSSRRHEALRLYHKATWGPSGEWPGTMWPEQSKWSSHMTLQAQGRENRDQVFSSRALQAAVLNGQGFRV